jgi:D-amino-acid dehydrogenase
MHHQHVAVIGAGIVGLATAAQLQIRGARVTLVDPAAPGEGCSLGNAGCLSRASVVPVGLPGLWKSVPGYLLDPKGPFRIDWRYAHRIAPWLWKLHAASRIDRVNAIADALHALLDPAIEEWRSLAQWAGAPELIRQEGYAFVYRSEAAFQADALGRELRRARGVKIEILTGGQIQELEPALSPSLTHLTWMPEQGHVPQPLRLSRQLATALSAAGAQFVRSKAIDFEFAENKVAAVVTESGRLACDAVVLAAGAHSLPLASRLGATVPLDTERGYHVMLKSERGAPRIPVCSGEGKFFATPMEDGLRVAGTVELAGLERPAVDARAQALAELVTGMLPGVNNTVQRSWMGFRPSMPDSLPVLGRSEHHANAFLNFGHGHVGLTAAAPSGRLLAEMIGGHKTTIDPAPYRANRFA